MNALATMDRRQFLGTTASGLTLGFTLNGFGPMREAHAAAASTQVNTWLSVGTDNSIVLTVGASDMGQGSFQGLGQVLAEDLMVDHARVTLVQGGPTMVPPASAPWVRRSPPWARASRATTTGDCVTPARSHARRWCRRR